MSEVRIVAERVSDAPADRICRCIADYGEHHAWFLPPAFAGYRVQDGGVGAGTVVSSSVTAGGWGHDFTMNVSEPEPGRVLVESDGTRATTFTVSPEGDRRSRTRIETAWNTGGIQGFFERLFAPRILRKVYLDELERLDQYVRKHAEV